MSPFKFHISEKVAIAEGSEVGRIIARAEYAESVPQYLVRYVAGDGRAVEAWWSEPALFAV